MKRDLDRWRYLRQNFFDVAPEPRFDVGIDWGLIEHFPDPGKRKLITHFRKFLTPGGLQICSSPRDRLAVRLFYRAFADELNTGYRELMTLRELVERIEGAGGVIEHRRHPPRPQHRRVPVTTASERRPPAGTGKTRTAWNAGFSRHAQGAARGEDTYGRDRRSSDRHARPAGPQQWRNCACIRADARTRLAERRLSAGYARTRPTQRYRRQAELRSTIGIVSGSSPSGSITGVPGFRGPVDNGDRSGSILGDSRISPEAPAR